MRIVTLFGGLVILLAGVPRPAAPADVPAVTYSVTDLGVFTPFAVNNRGQILGNADEYHAGLWTRGRVMRLPLPRGTISCQPKALNDAGTAVGTAFGERDNVRAVLWKNGRVVLLSRRESEAMDINNAGQIVGSVGNRAVVWEAGRAHDLGGMAGDAALLNDRGDILVAGWDDPTYRAIRRGGRYVLREIRDRVPNAVLEILDPGRSEISLFPAALNDRGEIAGGNRGHGDYNHRAFLWRPDPARPHAATSGTVRRLLAPGNADAGASGLNDAGQAVGYFQTSGANRACLWQGDACLDLNTLIAPGSGWILTYAAAINDRGQIVGEGQRNGVKHGFLLTPRAP